MSTHQTQRTDRSPEGFLTRIGALKPLVLIALIPLAAACTDTVTGLDQLTHEEESDIDQRPGAVDRPMARDLPVAR